MSVKFPPGVAFRDRTGDFDRLVARHRLSVSPSASGGSAPQPPTISTVTSTKTSLDVLREKENVFSARRSRLEPQTPFAQQVISFGDQLKETTLKVQSLAQAAQQSGLYDDRSAEIQTLTVRIKRDIQRLSSQIEDMGGALEDQRQRRQNKSYESAQAQKHAHNVVDALKVKLAKTTSSFKEALDRRTKVMRSQSDRRKQYVAAEQSALLPVSDSPLYRRTRGVIAETEDGDSGDGDDSKQVVINFGGEGQVQAMAGPRSVYYQARRRAVEAVESSVVELASMFQQVATMVADQEEMVERIDENVNETVFNVEAGQTQLLKYFDSVKSNRWLMVKVFSVVMVFLVLFFVVLF